jgi:hypothetical protein
MPSAPLITSLSSGFGTSQDTQSEVNSSSGTCQSFSLNGTMKCRAMPSPRFSRIQALKDRSAGGVVAGFVIVAINPSRHSRTTSGGKPQVFTWNGYSVYVRWE